MCGSQKEDGVSRFAKQVWCLANDLLQYFLQQIEIAAGMRIQNHQIDGQTVMLPVLMGEQHFADEFSVLSLFDVDEQNRTIPGNPKSPEPALSPATGSQCELGSSSF